MKRGVKVSEEPKFTCQEEIAIKAARERYLNGDFTIYELAKRTGIKESTLAKMLHPDWGKTKVYPAIRRIKLIHLTLKEIDRANEEAKEDAARSRRPT